MADQRRDDLLAADSIHGGHAGGTERASDLTALIDALSDGIRATRAEATEPRTPSAMVTTGDRPAGDGVDPSVWERRLDELEEIE